jgi:16S rRNA (uracil1498-N3)-methyltransferase
MSVTRLVVGAGSVQVGEVVLPEEVARHARVARVREGDPIELVDLAGAVGAGHLLRWEGKRCRVQVETVLTGRGEPPEPLVLGLGLLHTAAFDWAVEKATELGATAIVPVLSARVQGRLARPREGRWERIAAAAVAQCGRSRPPRIAAPVLLPAFLQGAEGLRLVADGGAAPLPQPMPTGGGGLTVLVGPEGGLTEGELRAARDAGFIPFGLGPRTLRAETAAVAALTVAQQLAGWW